MILLPVREHMNNDSCITLEDYSKLLKKVRISLIEQSIGPKSRSAHFRSLSVLGLRQWFQILISIDQTNLLINKHL